MADTNNILNATYDVFWQQGQNKIILFFMQNSFYVKGAYSNTCRFCKLFHGN